MDLIYKSNLQEIFFDKELKIIKNKWLSNTISFDDVKKEIKIWTEHIDETQAKLMLTDNSIGHVVTIEAQEWIANYMGPIMHGKGISKFAIIMSDKILSELSVEQVVDEVKEKVSNFQQLNFSNEEDAMKWLLS